MQANTLIYTKLKCKKIETWFVFLFIHSNKVHKLEAGEQDQNNAKKGPTYLAQNFIFSPFPSSYSTFFLSNQTRVYK